MGRLQPDTQPRPTPAPRELSIPVTEERLEVDHQVVDTGHTLRLRKEVAEVPDRVTDQVTQEFVEVSRVPVGRVVGESPKVRHEGDVLVVPVVEERLVTRKELVLVEEIRLTRRREVKRVQSDVLLRRERVVAERLDPETGEWRPEEGR